MTRPAADHPLLLQGRRHARDCIASAERIGLQTGDNRPSNTLSTALQMTVSAFLVDKNDPHDAYAAIEGLLAWSLLRLPEDDRMGVLQTMISDVVDVLKTAEPAPPEPAIN